MPTTLWGITLYVFTLFPGIAYVFARNGHRSTAKRSVLQETVTFVFVSFVCDAIFLILFLAADHALAWTGEWSLSLLQDDNSGPLKHLFLEVLLAPLLLIGHFYTPVTPVLLSIVQGDYSWPLAHPFMTVLFLFLAVVCATLLGYLLGSKWMYERGLKRIWKSAVPRDTSMWGTLFEVKGKAVVHVAVVLKSGGWVGGELYTYDDDPDPNPNRTITITNPRYRPPGSNEDDDLGNDFLVVAGSEIELLQINHSAIGDEEISTYEEAAADDAAAAATKG